MVVVPLVAPHLCYAEERLGLVQGVETPCTLRHYELVRYLVAGLVAFSTRPITLPDEADGEASFSIYETDHPSALLDQSFLLIVRTRHVVTITWPFPVRQWPNRPCTCDE